jgi:WD40 repeat protein
MYPLLPSEKIAYVPFARVQVNAAYFPYIDKTTLIDFKRNQIFSKVIGTGEFALFYVDKEVLTLIRKFVGHTEDITCFAITPDGEKVISGDEDGTIRIWEVETATCLHILRGHIGSISYLFVSPNGKQVISSTTKLLGGYTYSQYIFLNRWDIETGKCEYIWKQDCFEEEEVYLLGIISSYNIVVTLSNKGLQGWRMNEAGWISKIYTSLPIERKMDCIWGHKRELSKNFYPEKYVLTQDNQHIILVQKNRIEIWRIIGLVVWEIKCVHNLLAKSGEILSLAALPEGTFITGHIHGIIEEWDPFTGKCIQQLQTGYGTSVNFLAACNSHSLISTFMSISTGNKDTLRIWHKASAPRSFLWGEQPLASWCRSIKIEKEGVRYLKKGRAVTSDGKKIIGEDLNNTIVIKDIETSKILHVLVTPKNWQAPITFMVSTPDNKKVIAIDSRNTASVWAIEKGICLHTFSIPTCWRHYEKRLFTLSETGKYFVFSNGNDRTKKWPIETYESCSDMQHSLESHCSPFFISDDGNYFVSNYSPSPERKSSLKIGYAGKLMVIDIPYTRTLKDVFMTPSRNRIFYATHDEQGSIFIVDVDIATKKYKFRMRIKKIYAYKIRLNSEGDLDIWGEHFKEYQILKTSLDRVLTPTMADREYLEAIQMPANMIKKIITTNQCHMNSLEALCINTMKKNPIPTSQGDNTMECSIYQYS